MLRVVLTLVSLLHILSKGRSNNIESVRIEVYSRLLFNIMSAPTAYIIVGVNVHLVVVSKREREERRSVPAVVFLLVTEAYNRYLTTASFIRFIPTKRSEEYSSVRLHIVLKLLECNSHIVCSYP